MIEKDKLEQIFGEKDEGSTVAILVHPSPDPDALGSALGFSALLQNVWGLNSKIFHLGEVSHPQNRSMKNILHMVLSDGREFNPDDYCATVILDTDIEGTGVKNDKFHSADVRIDHHLMDRSNGATLKDVRMVGSTCSIVWEYLKEFGIDLEANESVATAMALGIQIDTLNFTTSNTSDLDMEAYRELLPHIHQVFFRRILKYDLPKITFEAEARAYADKEIRNTSLVTYIGELSPQSRDVIPIVADRLVRMDSVKTVFVLGIIDNCIVSSVRSVADGVDVNDVCIKVFGKENAGGKEGSGGARSELGTAYELLTDKETKDKVKEEMISSLKEKIFDALGEHKSDEE
jgi:nanoRNase/pAp phosphatase (c-di-AMP/oligoRNAs hydrolase)